MRVGHRQRQSATGNGPATGLGGAAGEAGVSADDTDLPRASPVSGRPPALGALVLGQWGPAFRADPQLKRQDPVLLKPRITPFHGTPLEADLRAGGWSGWC